MRLELSEAISLILALPSHRSNNEGHRKMGEKALEFLMDYKDFGESDTDKQFNRTMISYVMSTVRAFSVERDRISSVWASIREVKKRRERWLDVTRNLSPFEKGNYWSRTISILLAAGFTIKFPLPETNIQCSMWTLVGFLVGFETLSKISEILLSTTFEKWLPIEQQNRWEEESLSKYKNIVGKFIDEAVENYKKYYPEEKTIYEYDITDKDKINELKKHLIEKHFYF
ncbi:MAG: hypothetical protein J7L77_07785 [Clostridiales bacterium]|nr:hypothetical protein [Clostridiales bacterium]